jgi:polyisoprenoid-binding protein YceI
MSSISDLTPGTWNVDPSHSTVGFVARHLMVTKVRGRFQSFSGVLNIAADPLQSSVDASVELASITTGDESRDTHLKSADFFDVEKNTTMTFRSTSIKPAGDDYEMTGDLTINGITKPVTFELEFEGVNKDPWGNTKAGFSAEAEISRKAWGLEWNVALETGGVLVGDKIKIQLDIQAAKAA